jgi:nicotinate-nucleotide adenylyltransferase
MAEPEQQAHGAIGIFGGTFDPVHFGHLRAALEAREKLALDDFRLLPAGTPPHRSGTLAPARHRLAMLRLAVAGVPGFSVDDREIRREGNSYMVDTLAEIRKTAGDAPLLLMIGQDSANTLDSWHEWKRIYGLAHLVIMRRPDSRPSWTGELREQMQRRIVRQPDQLKRQSAGLVLQLAVTQLAISSTGIRKQLQAGQSPRFLLPGAVLEYIRQNELYFAGAARKG